MRPAKQTGSFVALAIMPVPRVSPTTGSSTLRFDARQFHCPGQTNGASLARFARRR